MLARFAARQDLRASKRGTWLTGRMPALTQRGLSKLAWTVDDVPPLVGPR